jgi:hypothetical protein
MSREYVLTDEEIEYLAENTRVDLQNRGERFCKDMTRVEVSGPESFAITAATGRLPLRKKRWWE